MTKSSSSSSSKRPAATQRRARGAAWRSQIARRRAGLRAALQPTCPMPGRADAPITRTWLAYVRWKALLSALRSLNCSRPTSPSAPIVSWAASAGTISWWGWYIWG